MCPLIKSPQLHGETVKSKSTEKKPKPNKGEFSVLTVYCSAVNGERTESSVVIM